MKRMNDIFELPVRAALLGFVFDVTTPDDDKAIANAINHIDSLADALESLTSDYVSYRAVNGIDLTDDHSAALDVKMNLAIAALAAYRGEK
jgi:hypothetical protein